MKTQAHWNFAISSSIRLFNVIVFQIEQIEFVTWTVEASLSHNVALRTAFLFRLLHIFIIPRVKSKRNRVK